ncbi:MAG: hypothetical protein RL660_2781 [Bacteroidota bacterium]|jgi:hypothetical protein
MDIQLSKLFISDPEYIRKYKPSTYNGLCIFAKYKVISNSLPKDFSTNALLKKYYKNSFFDGLKIAVGKDQLEYLHLLLCAASEIEEDLATEPEIIFDLAIDTKESINAMRFYCVSKSLFKRELTKQATCNILWEYSYLWTWYLANRFVNGMTRNNGKNFRFFVSFDDWNDGWQLHTFFSFIVFDISTNEFYLLVRNCDYN